MSDFKTTIVEKLTQQLFEVSCELDRKDIEQRLWFQLYQKEVQKRAALLRLCIQKGVPLEEIQAAEKASTE